MFESIVRLHLSVKKTFVDICMQTSISFRALVLSSIEIGGCSQSKFRHFSIAADGNGLVHSSHKGLNILFA